jgi:hypothetical protein
MHVVCALLGVQADGSADPRPRAPGDHQPFAADSRRGARPPTTHARRAFALDELDDRRDVSPLRGCIDVLRRCLSGFATGAEHVLVVVDGTGRVPWLDGDPRVRLRVDRPTFEEGI